MFHYFSCIDFCALMRVVENKTLVNASRINSIRKKKPALLNINENYIIKKQHLTGFFELLN